MKYETIQKLVNAIQEIENWTSSIDNQFASGSIDFEKVERFTQYRDDAKQVILDIATK